MIRNTLLALLLLCGCLTANTTPLEELGFEVPATDHSVAAENITWPDFSGQTLRIVDHGAFKDAFNAVKPIFENLTGATVVRHGEADAGTMLANAIKVSGHPAYDVMYGVDNALWQAALQGDVFEPYTPQLAARVDPSFVFFGHENWPATPVDHGYIALNVHESGAADPVDDLQDLLDQADQFVTQDPRTSSPGLGFFLTTVAAYPYADVYNWEDYWTDLLAAGTLVTPGWSEAYGKHFTGGYGRYDTTAPQDRAIVTSYTSSPAYEAYWGETDLSQVVYGTQETPLVFQQIQTMGILRGTPNLGLAQAWIEFTLTEDFQEIAAPYNAIYPVDPEISVAETYGTIAADPGTFAYNDAREIGDLELLLSRWATIYEASQA